MLPILSKEKLFKAPSVFKEGASHQNSEKDQLISIVKRRIEMGMNEYSPNVELIREQGIRIITKLPREVRKELMAGVKSGALGRLKSEGLKPEIFYHPDRKQEAIELQISEALYAIQCISKVIHIE